MSDRPWSCSQFLSLTRSPAFVCASLPCGRMSPHGLTSSHGRHPQLLHTAIDTTDARALAEFYRQLLGLQYRPGDEPPADGEGDVADRLVLVDSNGARKLAFQRSSGW